MDEGVCEVSTQALFDCSRTRLIALPLRVGWTHERVASAARYFRCGTDGQL
jgi:hypothetical protein